MNHEKIEPSVNVLQKFWEIIIAITAWIAILFQAYLTTGSFGNLFSYFTILTNLLTASALQQFFLFRKKVLGFFVRNHQYKQP